MTKYHYVYRITNKKENKHYYGIRSSKVEPKLDLGFKYFSSSKDKAFISDQRENKDDYKYKVIKIFSSREEAIKLEIKLHNKFNVGISESFYNRAKQTSNKWDTTGINHTIEAKNKISKSKKGIKMSEEFSKKISVARTGIKISDEGRKKLSIAFAGEKNGMYGKKHSVKTKEKMSLVLTGRKFEKLKCEHCDVIMSSNNIQKYHMNNCKNR